MEELNSWREGGAIQPMKPKSEGESTYLNSKVFNLTTRVRVLILFTRIVLKTIQRYRGSGSTERWTACFMYLSNIIMYQWSIQILSFLPERMWIIEYFYQLITKSICYLNNLINLHVTLITFCFNPLSPHDALKHHLTSLKKNSIFLKQMALERKFPWNWFTNTCQFSLLFHPHQIIFIHYKSRIATAIRGL